MESKYYWHIELYSGEIIKVRPNHEKVLMIQDKISKQEGSITTPTRSIIIKDIKDFRLSDEIYSDQKLLESSARAFREPLFNKDGSIQARMVKKSVTRRKWDSFYRHIPAYRLLEESDSFVMMAYRLPVHMIDPTSVEEITPEEDHSLIRF